MARSTSGPHASVPRDLHSPPFFTQRSEKSTPRSTKSPLKIYLSWAEQRNLVDPGSMEISSKFGHPHVPNSYTSCTMSSCVILQWKIPRRRLNATGASLRFSMLREDMHQVLPNDPENGMGDVPYKWCTYHLDPVVPFWCRIWSSILHPGWWLDVLYHSIYQSRTGKPHREMSM